MQLVPLFEGQLRYTALQSISYDAGGQLYGTMEGQVSGDSIIGALHLTNLAPQRPDNVNCPTLRGILTTNDEAAVYVELNGLANLRQSDGARVFATSMTFRTGHEEYRWLNTVLAIAEGVLDSVSVGGLARIRVYRCEVTL